MAILHAVVGLPRVGQWRQEAAAVAGTAGRYKVRPSTEIFNQVSHVFLATIFGKIWSRHTCELCLILLVFLARVEFTN
jgi:hypothetical protein